jgi:hypothetical protein
MASDYPYVIFKPLLILLCRGRDRMVVGFTIKKCVLKKDYFEKWFKLQITYLYGYKGH